MAEENSKIVIDAYESITKEAAPKECTFDTAEAAFITAAAEMLVKLSERGVIR